MDSVKDIILEKAVEQFVTLFTGKTVNDVKEILKENEKQKVLLRCFEKFCDSDLYKYEFDGTGCEVDKELILNISDKKISIELDENELIKNLDYVFKKCILVDDQDKFKRIVQCICKNYRDESKRMLELFHIFQELKNGNVAGEEARNEFRKYFESVLFNQRNTEDVLKKIIMEIKQLLEDSLNTKRNNKSETIVESAEYKIALEYLETNDFEEAISILRKLYSLCNDDMERKKICFQIGFCYLKWSVNKGGDKKSIEDAINYLNKSISNIDFLKIEDEDFLIYKNLSRAYEELSNYKDPKKNYENAEEYVISALDLLQGIKDNKNDLIELQLDLARIYENLCEYCSNSNVKIYFDKAISIYKLIIESEKKLPEESAFVLLHNIGRIYEKKAELEGKYTYLDDALEYYLKAEKVPYSSAYNNPEQFALLHNNLGNIYFKKDNIAKQDEEKWLNDALRHYELALDVYSCDEYRYNFSQTSTNKGRVFRRKYRKYNREEDFVESKRILEEVLKYRTPTTDPSGYAYVKIELAQLYTNRVENNYIIGIKDNQDVSEEKNECALELLSCAENLCKDALCILNKDLYEKMYCSVLHIYAEALALKGRVTTIYKDFEDALNMCKEVLLLCKDSNSHMFQVVIENTISIMCYIFDCIENTDEKYSWYLKQLEYLHKINAEKYSFPIYHNISVILFKKYDEEDEIEFLKDALNYLSQYKIALRKGEFDNDTQNMFDNLWERIEREIEQHSN